MSKRFISLLLALCYLSVSLGVFSIHFHDHGDRISHSCPACAWHSASVSDEPAGPTFATIPVVLVAPVAEASPQLRLVSPRVSSDRGPPFLS